MEDVIQSIEEIFGESYNDEFVFEGFSGVSAAEEDITDVEKANQMYLIKSW